MPRSPDRLRQNVRLGAVLVAVFAVGLATPSIAASINADKVDGKDAVGAGASISARAGKLVATNSAGRLPNNIVTKAPDANKLDGLDGTAFVKTGTVRTEAYTCAGTAFVPVFASGITNASGSLLFSSNSALVRCNVDLPTNALVTKVEFQVQDSDAAAGIGCDLWRTSTASGSVGFEQRMANASTAGTPGATVIADTSIVNPAVDTSHTYFAQCTLGTTGSVGVYGVSVTYDYNEGGAPLAVTTTSGVSPGSGSSTD